jgi:hypothetical protein
MQISCESSEIEFRLTEIIEIVRGNGGLISDDISIIQTGAELAIQCAADGSDNPTILELSSECMVRLDLFKLSTNGGDIELQSHEPDAGAVEVRLMELMLDIYNLTAKLPCHRAVNPLFALRYDKPLLELLLRDRPIDLERLNQLEVGEEREKQVLLDSFLNTRALSFQFQDGIRKVLMPIVDYLNNHSEGSSFRRKDTILSMSRSTPNPGSDECFARYSLAMDALDLYLIYNYVSEEDLMFVRSSNMRLELSDLGTIDFVRKAPSTFKGKLAARNRDLRFWIPALARIEGNANVGSLLIPAGHSPNALRRALFITLRHFFPTAAKEKLQKGVVEAETKIIEENLNYLSKLTDLTELSEAPPQHRDALQSVKRVLELQTRRFRSQQKLVSEFKFPNKTQQYTAQ